MHPAFQERAAELGVLLQKTQAALFGRIDQPEPCKPVRFQVRVKSKGMCQVIDLATEEARAFREGYKAAHDMAIQFEEKASRFP